MFRRTVFLPLALVFVTVAIGAAWPSPPQGEHVIVTTTALPLDNDAPQASRLGPLTYMGGVVIDSRDRRFGGLSGLRWRDGALWAVSDDGGFWRIATRENGGRLVGIDSVATRRLTGEQGKELKTKEEADAESLEMSADGRSLWIGYERRNRLRIYERPAGDSLQLTARPTIPGINRAMAGWPVNGGPEAIAGMSPDDGIILSEEQAGPDGSTLALRVRPGARQPEILRFGYRAPEGFKATDAALLPDGRLLVLNRRFSLLEGVAAALVVLDTGGVAAGDVLTGTEIARLQPPVNVDNMEGIAVRQEAGRTAIYLVSDDNFNPLQRTLLMKFALQH
jgi:hypothetical protein